MDPEFEELREQFCRTNCTHFEVGQMQALAVCGWCASSATAHAGVS